MGCIILFPLPSEAFQSCTNKIVFPRFRRPYAHNINEVYEKLRVATVRRLELHQKHER